MSKTKEFSDGLIDLQMQVSRAYADEVHRLRQENAALRKTIAAFPSTATELQDQVTMLKGLLMAARNPPNGHS